MCAVLKNLIEEHHTMFIELYQEWTVIPKMHYMTHYPEQILALGPLVRAWTMRYEAKLFLLKSAGRVSNFKNITQTISSRHQRWACYELSSGGALSSAVECGPASISTPLYSESAALKEKIANLAPGISEDTLVSRVAWTKVHGITYKPRDAYVICFVSNKHLAEPTLSFGRIEEVLVVSSDLVLFLATMYKSQYYDDHFHAYVVERSSEQCIVSQTSILDPVILHSRTVCNNLFIAPLHF